MLGLNSNLKYYVSILNLVYFTNTLLAHRHSCPFALSSDMDFTFTVPIIRNCHWRGILINQSDFHITIQGFKQFDRQVIADIEPRQKPVANFKLVL